MKKKTGAYSRSSKTMHGVAGVFSKINTTILELEAIESNAERSSKVERGTNELLGD